MNERAHVQVFVQTDNCNSSSGFQVFFCGVTTRTTWAAAASNTSTSTNMKLLLHNFLQCHIKGVKNGYPLQIEAAKVTERDADYDPGRLAMPV